MPSPTRQRQFTANVPTLHVAFDLSKQRWKLASSAGLGHRPRRRTITAWDAEALRQEFCRAKAKAGLPPDARVVTAHEAGRDGFAVHRFLEQLGVESVVLDAASIELPRHFRRAKTDRLDAEGLLRVLISHVLGERGRVRVVHVPTREQEDARQLHRELKTAQQDAQAVRNRISGLLAAQGARLPRQGTWTERLAAVRLPDGAPLPPDLHARLTRETSVLEVMEARIATLADVRHARVVHPDPADPGIAAIRQLMGLKSIGETGAWTLVREYLGWRDFRNRRQVGGGSGLTGTPYNSGDQTHEQGISKAGNDRIRTLMVELAWMWRRYQPHSDLTQWFERRWGHAGARARRVGIVALARKLLIALWRYLKTGELPGGAELKTA